MRPAPGPRFEEIRPRTRRMGRVLVHLDRVASTMAEARAAAEQGEPDGFVVVAEEQTGGVGRHGRHWFSPRGNLHATVVLRPTAPRESLTWIPLLGGVALVEAVRRVTRLAPRLKWPNDVVLEGRKLAGVLTEARWAGAGEVEWVLLGVGVNGNVAAEAFPAGLAGRATSLRAATGHAVCLPALLKVFLERLEAELDGITAPFEDLAGRVERHVETLGRRVRVDTGEGVVEGLAVGLGPRGELLVETEGGERRVEAGDCEHVATLPLVPNVRH